MEIIIDNTSKWSSKDLPVNTYFTVEDDKDYKGKIFLKVYGDKVINILNGNETFGSNVLFKKCVIINKLKISIEQM